MDKTERAVAINFCGGCNPVINRGDIAAEIRSALACDGFTVTFNDWNAGFIVRLSGCPTNCTSRDHPPEHPETVIAGKTFAAVTVKEDELAGLAIAAVRAHFERGGDVPGHSQCERRR